MRARAGRAPRPRHEVPDRQGEGGVGRLRRPVRGDHPQDQHDSRPRRRVHARRRAGVAKHGPHEPRDVHGGLRGLRHRGLSERFSDHVEQREHVVE